MPTPTPLPPQIQNQIIQAGSEFAMAVINQGIAAVLPLFFLMLLVLSIGVVIYLIKRPVAKPDTQVSDNQIMLQLAKNNDGFRQLNEDQNKQYLELGKRSVAAHEQGSEAAVRSNAIQEKYITDIAEVKQLLTKIDTVGSLPLQNAILSIGSIKTNVENIGETVSGYGSLFERVSALLEGAEVTLKKVDDRLATKEISKVVPPATANGTTTP